MCDKSTFGLKKIFLKFAFRIEESCDMRRPAQNHLGIFLCEALRSAQLICKSLNALIKNRATMTTLRPTRDAKTSTDVIFRHSWNKMEDASITKLVNRI